MKITDIYDQLDARESDVEILNFEGSHMDHQEKERILKKALEKIPKTGEATNVRQDGRIFKVSGKKRIGLLVLAAVFLMGFTVSAAEYFRLNGNLLSFLGISPEHQPEELESMVSDLEQAENVSWKTEDEYNGVRIRAGQTVSDGETIYVYFDIELPDGMFMDSDDEVTRIVHFRESEYSIGTLKGDTAIEIQRDENAPGQYYAIAEIGLDTFNAGEQELSVAFRNLGYAEADDSSTNWVDLVPGEWTLNWKSEYHNTSQSYSVKKSFTIKEGTVEIQSVRLSPFSIKLTGVIESSEFPIDSLISIDGIILEDGSCTDEIFKSRWTDAGDANLVMQGTFKNMADVDSIKGVRVNGVDILFEE